MASVLPNQSKRCCNEEKYIRANHRSISLIFRAVMQNIPKSELLTLHSETGWIFVQLKKKKQQQTTYVPKFKHVLCVDTKVLHFNL